MWFEFLASYDGVLWMPLKETTGVVCNCFHKCHIGLQMQHSCARISTNIGLRWIYQAVLSSFLPFSKPLSNQALLPSAACSCDVMQIPWWVTSSHGRCILNKNLSSQSNDVIAGHKTVFSKYIVLYTANITTYCWKYHITLCLDLHFTSLQSWN